MSKITPVVACSVLRVSSLLEKSFLLGPHLHASAVYVPSVSDRGYVTDVVLDFWQGGIAGSSIFIIIIGASGLLTILLRFIGPITVRRVACSCSDACA